MRDPVDLIATALTGALMGAFFAWVSVNALTGCSHLAPDACWHAPWIGR
jgi:hypothetical protein